MSHRLRPDDPTAVDLPAAAGGSGPACRVARAGPRLDHEGIGCDRAPGSLAQTRRRNDVADQHSQPPAVDWLELAAVLLLAVTAIMTAWTGFQSSKWSGAMSISFAQASTARIDAARMEGIANRKQTIQVSLFTQWLQAHQAHDEALTKFLTERFPEPLASAFPAWVATKPLITPGAPSTPFEMPQYVIPELVAAQAAD